MHKPHYDISHELCAIRCGSAIRLVKPLKSESSCYSEKSKVSHLLGLPINFYFLDVDSTITNMNEITAETCGYLSRTDAIGKSIRSVATPETANSILENDRYVLKKNALTITEETYTRLDDKELTAISIKFPLINDRKHPIGILGCSILLGESETMSLTHSLCLLMETGLLSPSVSKKLLLPGLQCDNMYFNERDMNILNLLVRGKTAKEIGKILKYSHRTIEHRLEKIKIKTGVTTKAQLIDKVIEYFI